MSGCNPVCYDDDSILRCLMSFITGVITLYITYMFISYLLVGLTTLNCHDEGVLSLLSVSLDYYLDQCFLN